MKTGLVADERYRLHDPGAGHPERRERYDYAVKGVIENVPAGQIRIIKPRPAAIREIQLVHTKEYVSLVRDDIEQEFGSLRTGDTSICPESWDCALLAAGGVLSAIDVIMTGEINRAFCAVRPPGHHAASDRGMGFCIFNNIAIGARYAQKKHGIKRVLIVDWDIHHGNGTQDMFYDDPSVMYFSTHQWPFYPGTGAIHEQGEGKGRGFTINCPMQYGSTGRDMIGEFGVRLLPAVKEFKPEFVMISAGFDAMGGDPVGQFALSPKDFHALTVLINSVADKYAGGRVVSVLEGGYDLHGLADCCGAHFLGLAGM